MTAQTRPTQCFVAARLHRNNISRDRPHGQRRGDPPDDILSGHRPMQEKHVDERPGAAGIAVGLTSCRPERFMRSSEHPRRAGVCESGGPGKGAGLVQENLEVMIKIHALS